ncbi:MAG: sigma-70 family RNA polymerase sigma factor [Sedimentisphaerales bacterium]|nr:sigma-70 family RNA polymerase sigma factor [Sedimentisphaerales bacterium]
MMNSSDGQLKNEAALVCAARNGDKQALLTLLKSNWNWLKGLMYNVLGDPDQVDEAMQNLCLLLLTKINTVREPERFKGWLSIVARNSALSLRQKNARNNLCLSRVLPQEQLIEPGPDIPDQLDRAEQHQKLLQAIKLLPEKYREVFLLKYMDEKSYAEIAEILEVPVTTVQIRLVRARRMIFNRLTGKPTDKVPRT